MKSKKNIKLLVILLGLTIINIFVIYMKSNFSILGNSENYIKNSEEFYKYYTYDFEQIEFENNCGPTLATNVLSYFKDTYNLNDLYDGIITQDMYDKICVDVEYTYDKSTTLSNVTSGLKKICAKYGYTCIIDKYILNLWSDLTRDIDRGYPVLLSYNLHGYMIVGYRVNNGVRQIKVFTNWNNIPYMWLDFEASMQMQSVYIY